MIRKYNGQKCDDTKGVIISRKSKDRQYNGQKCDDTKGVIRSRKSKIRHYNGQKRKIEKLEKQKSTKHYKENLMIEKQDWLIVGV